MFCNASESHRKNMKQHKEGNYPNKNNQDDQQGNKIARQTVHVQV